MEHTPTEPIALPPASKGRAWPVLALLGVLALCAVQRIWLIDHAEVIAADGTIYVRMAREFFAHPRDIIADNDYHVGYPAAIAAVHDALGLGDDPAVWDTTAQGVSLGFSLLAIAGVYVLAGKMFNWRVAWIGALLWGLGRKWAGLGADVLSDAPAVALQTWAIVLAVLAAGLLSRRWWGPILLAAGAGILAGGAYLIRPEGLAASLVGAGVCLAAAVRHRKWGRGAVTVAVLVLLTIATAAPYMAAIGGLTKKNSIVDFDEFLGLLGPTCQMAALTKSHDYFALRQLLNMVFEAMHPVAATLMVIGLLGRVLKKPLAQRLPEGTYPKIAFEPLMAVCLGVAVYAPIATILYVKVGYMSHRHVAELAALLVPLAGAGLVFVWGVATSLTIRPLRKGMAGFGHWILVVALVAVILPHSLKPPHHGKGYHRDAGRFLREHTADNAKVLTDSAWVLHYARRPGRVLNAAEVSARDIRRITGQEQPDWLVLSDRTLDNSAPELKTWLTPDRFQLVQVYRRTKGHTPDAVRIYRVHGD